MRLLSNIRGFAGERPERAAIINAQCAERELTYRQLDQYSDRLAKYLHRNISNDKRPVIVYGDKNPYMAVVFLACVKSGHPYCPIDSVTPGERMRKIIESVRPEIIFATEDFQYDGYKILSLNEIKDICFDANNDDKRDYGIETLLKQEDVFYVLFTSGSTGESKGVEITAACLDNFLKWIADLIEGYMCDDFVALNQMTYTFDFAQMELYVPLYVGGTSYIIDNSIQANFKKMMEAFKKSEAVIAMSTPYMAEMCLLSKRFSQELMPKLRAIFFCGDVLENATALKLIKRFPSMDVINMYGPTESTIAVTQQIITEEIASSPDPLPIGVAKPGSKIEIWDENGKALNCGETGEIVIKGDTVAKGYYNNPKLTELAFVPYKDGEQTKKAYRSGDLGFIDKDGAIHYKGRMDSQIQLHGYRIELGDIEANLTKLDMVSQAAVIPKSDEEKVDYLVGFVSVDEDWKRENGDKGDLSLLIKEELKKHVPDYMIPRKIECLNELPANKNGKIDRKKLKLMLADK